MNRVLWSFELTFNCARNFKIFDIKQFYQTYQYPQRNFPLDAYRVKTFSSKSVLMISALNLH